MLRISKKIDKCLLSKKKVSKIIDLGIHPFADTFVKKNQLHKVEPIFPLQCYMCKQSGHVQLGRATLEEKRYNMYSYSYTSSNSKFSREHWKNFHTSVTKKFNINNNKILEIGSNDGYLLGLFKKNNNVLGIDASKEMSKIATQNFNIPTLNYTFSTKIVPSILRSSGKFDLIVANNVLNHSNNPINFFAAVKKLLKKNGLFIFEVPNWGVAIKKNKFDQIYHEHVSYFTFKSIYYLIQKSKFKIIYFKKINYHGGSLRVVIGFNENKKYKKLLKSEICKEIDSGLFKIKTYKQFFQKILTKKKLILKKLNKAKSLGYAIVGIGAAAKANTWLVFNEINSKILNCITDASKYKIGKFTPFTRIPIKNDEVLRKYKKLYVIILSWNISHLLKIKLKKINSNIKFL